MHWSDREQKAIVDPLVALLGVASVHILAVMSPGPNFVVAARSGLRYTRSAAVITAAGLATGTVIYISLGLLGATAFVLRAGTFFVVVRLIGAGYLAILGVRAILAGRRDVALSAKEQIETTSRWRAYSRGLLTNLSSPSTFAYFLAVFTTFVPADAPFSLRGSMGLTMALISLSWYSLVAVTFSDPRVRAWYRRISRFADWAFGLVMIGFAVSLALG